MGICYRFLAVSADSMLVEKSSSPKLRTVFFDLGETLIDETRYWSAWADWLGVPRFTFFAVLGAVIARGEEHRNAFETLRPGIDLAHEAAERERVGNPAVFERADLYPDVMPCLKALRGAGYRLGVAGNQPSHEMIARLDLPVDIVGSSAAWGVRKPDPEFFRRMIDAAGRPAGRVAYVGDRVDHDVVPAADAGMFAVFLRRGPWGHLHATRRDIGRARLHIHSLDELSSALV